MKIKADQKPETYDEMYLTGGAREVFTLPYRHSCHYPMFKKILKILKKNGSSGVLEVGSGTGAFAHMLLDAKFKNYRGFDFSGEAVRQAKIRTGRDDIFFVKDAMNKNAYKDWEGYDTIVCTEVLEHVPDDIGLINLWPKGKRFIASVPNFDSKYHERFFKSSNEVLSRYRGILEIENLIEIKNPFLADISYNNYLREIRWNRYRPKTLLKILGFGSIDDVGCRFLFSGQVGTSPPKKISSTSLFNKAVSNKFVRRKLSPKGFIVFHIGRSGSSVLTDMLNQNKRIECAGEIFHGYFGELGKKEALARGADSFSPWTESVFFPTDPLGYIRHHFENSSLLSVKGFEIKPYHISSSGIAMEKFISQIKSTNFNRFIVLKRRNFLRKIVSSLVGKHKKIMHVNSGEKVDLKRIVIEPNCIEIDSDKKTLLQFLNDYDKSFVELKNLLPPDSTMELSYEEDIQEDPSIAYSKVCDFLGVSSNRSKVTLSRTTPFKLNDIIINFPEIKEYLKETPYKWMLKG